MYEALEPFVGKMAANGFVGTCDSRMVEVVVVPRDDVLYQIGWDSNLSFE